jgi:signal transduction histidine kinase
MRSDAQAQPNSGRLRLLNRPLSTQFVVLGIISLVLLLALGILSAMVVTQARATETLLNYNYYDEQRVMFQLDRELMRLRIKLASPPEETSEKAINTQVDLVGSRLAVLDFPLVQIALSPALVERNQAIATDWEQIEPDVRAWAADTSNLTLRESLRQRASDLEQQVLTSEINYSRARSIAVASFVRANQLLLLAFAIGALVLVIAVIVVGAIFYRIVKKTQQAEADRKANRLKDQFMAVMSHELRTPLNAIIGFLGIMKMTGNLEERNLYMVDRARANAERLLALINDILDISKIEAGKLVLVMSPVSPRKISDHWKSQMEVLAKQKNLEFSVIIDEGLPATIDVDEDALTKIATNLLSNAFKFTEKGSVTLNLLRGAPNQWIIRVTDTGIGIPEDAQGLIFESFRQVDGSIRRVYGGSGLGLSIVQRLCQAMGGTVTVESTVAKGSTFTVTLPLVVPSVKPVAPKTDLNPRPAGVAAPSK